VIPAATTPAAANVVSNKNLRMFNSFALIARFDMRPIAWTLRKDALFGRFSTDDESRRLV